MRHETSLVADRELAQAIERNAVTLPERPAVAAPSHTVMRMLDTVLLCVISAIVSAAFTIFAAPWKVVIGAGLVGSVLIALILWAVSAD